MNDDVFIVPAEVRTLVITEEELVIEVPADWRQIEVPEDASGQ